MIDPMRQDRNTQRNDLYEVRTELGEDLIAIRTVFLPAQRVLWVPNTMSPHATWVYSWRRLASQDLGRLTSILQRFPVVG